MESRAKTHQTRATRVAGSARRNSLAEVLAPRRMKSHTMSHINQIIEHSCLQSAAFIYIYICVCVCKQRMAHDGPGRRPFVRRPFQTFQTKRPLAWWWSAYLHHPSPSSPRSHSVHPHVVASSWCSGSAPDWIGAVTGNGLINAGGSEDVGPRHAPTCSKDHQLLFGAFVTRSSAAYTLQS